MMVGDLFGFGSIGSWPWPLLIGAGLVLAIASNHDKRIRVFPKSSSHNPDGRSPSSSSEVETHQTSEVPPSTTPREPQLPVVKPSKAPLRKSVSSSVSFTIERTTQQIPTSDPSSTSDP